MKKSLLLLLALNFCSLCLLSQDIIVLKNDVIDNVKVVEVTPDEVKYKAPGDTNGSVSSVKSSGVLMVKYSDGKTERFNSNYYMDDDGKRKFTHEIDLYLGEGWGIGYQLRQDYNRFVGWNIVGISYMNNFSSLKDVCLINLKLVGVRGYTPSYKWLRGYGDLCLGYSFLHDFGYNTHHLGIDLNLGMQVHKHFAFGANLIYCLPDPFSYVGVRFSYIF